MPPEVWDEISQTYGVPGIPHGAQEALAKGPATSEKDPLQSSQGFFFSVRNQKLDTLCW